MREKELVLSRNCDDIWREISEDFARDAPLQYQTIIQDDEASVLLDLDIDLGGGFESGYELTTLSSKIRNKTNFRFAIHDQDFIDEIGKFFGMQDATTGYPDFDEKLVVKTNNETEVMLLFKDAEVREVLQDLKDFHFGIVSHTDDKGDSQIYLELVVEEGITDVTRLQLLHRTFVAVLKRIESLQLL
ncbi:hypothetical protein [Pedobacter sp. SYSU D00535]|uniref:hypothetical protein n=1 Tax=Pedobacter sp. SYSU D00535 TaxID=2810308 RepID=UPI001A977B16|nr:hypothetical protein [Pedobacter sp. SYSU D00535]